MEDCEWNTPPTRHEIVGLERKIEKHQWDASEAINSYCLLLTCCKKLIEIVGYCGFFPHLPPANTTLSYIIHMSIQSIQSEIYPTPRFFLDGLTHHHITIRLHQAHTSPRQHLAVDPQPRWMDQLLRSQQHAQRTGRAHLGHQIPSGPISGRWKEMKRRRFCFERNWNIYIYIITEYCYCYLLNSLFLFILITISIYYNVYVYIYICIL